MKLTGKERYFFAEIERFLKVCERVYLEIQVKSLIAINICTVSLSPRILSSGLRQKHMKTTP